MAEFGRSMLESKVPDQGQQRYARREAPPPQVPAAHSARERERAGSKCCALKTKPLAFVSQLRDSVHGTFRQGPQESSRWPVVKHPNAHSFRRTTCGQMQLLQAISRPAAGLWRADGRKCNLSMLPAPYRSSLAIRLRRQGAWMAKHIVVTTG